MKQKISEIKLRCNVRKIKYLGINSTKELKNLYPEIIRHWRKKLKKIQINGGTD